MEKILRAFSFIAFAFGVLMFFSAKSAIHEIEGLVLFLIGAVFISAAFVINTIKNKGDMSKA